MQVRVKMCHRFLSCYSLFHQSQAVVVGCTLSVDLEKFRSADQPKPRVSADPRESGITDHNTEDYIETTESLERKLKSLLHVDLPYHKDTRASTLILSVSW